MPDRQDPPPVRARCRRIKRREACDDCGYPFCEAMTDTDRTLPHLVDQDGQPIREQPFVWTE